MNVRWVILASLVLCLEVPVAFAQRADDEPGYYNSGPPGGMPDCMRRIYQAGRARQVALRRINIEYLDQRDRNFVLQQRNTIIGPQDVRNPRDCEETAETLETWVEQLSVIAERQPDDRRQSIQRECAYERDVKSGFTDQRVNRLRSELARKNENLARARAYINVAENRLTVQRLTQEIQDLSDQLREATSERDLLRGSCNER